MTPDLHYLVYSALLAWIMIMTAAVLRARPWTMQGVMLMFSNREDVPPPTSIAGRAERAARNMLVNLTLLVALLLAVHAANLDDPKVATGAALFFWARLVYFPIYVAGLIYIRTAAWLVSIGGLAMILAAVW